MEQREEGAWGSRFVVLGARALTGGSWRQQHDGEGRSGAVGVVLADGGRSGDPTAASSRSYGKRRRRGGEYMFITDEHNLCSSGNR
jgi:hypothetical protein